MFIALEGIDASGKATQAAMLTDRLTRLGRAPLSVAFPRYDTPLGRLILRALRGEIVVAEGYERADGRRGASGLATMYENATVLQCLMLVDKCDGAVDIHAALRAGTDVVLDRWWPSAIAYGSADGLASDWLFRTVHVLPAPDVMILLDVPPTVARQRRPRAQDRYEADREQQLQVRAHYLDLWAKLGASCRVVDGVGTIEEVHDRVWNEVLAVQTKSTAG